MLCLQQSEWHWSTARWQDVSQAQGASRASVWNGRLAEISMLPHASHAVMRVASGAMLQSAACCMQNYQVSLPFKITVWLERSSADAVHNVQIKVPATIMYGTGKEGCGVRKPEAGMWDFFVEHLNDGVQPGVHHCLSAAALMLSVLCRRQPMPACEPCTSRNPRCMMYHLLTLRVIEEAATCSDG